VYGHRLIVLMLGNLSMFNVNSLSAYQAVSNLEPAREQHALNKVTVSKMTDTIRKFKVVPAWAETVVL